MEDKALVKNGENDAVIDAEYDSPPVVSRDGVSELVARLEGLLQRRDLNKIASDEQALNNFLRLQKNIFRVMVNSTKPRDWIDRNNFPELQGSGFRAIRFALQIGMYWTKKPTIESKGGHRYATCEGIFFHPQLGVIQEMGSRSTEDKFVADWTDDDLKKCAIANLFSRGMRGLLGLSQLTWEELQAVNPDLKPEDASRIEHKTGGKGGSRESEWDEDTKIMAEWIHYWIKEMTGGKPEQYKPYLVNVSQFNDVPGVERVSELTPGRVKVVYGKVKKEYDKFVAKNGGGNGGANKSHRQPETGAGSDPGPDPDNHYGDNGNLFD